MRLKMINYAMKKKSLSSEFIEMSYIVKFVNDITPILAEFKTWSNNYFIPLIKYFNDCLIEPSLFKALLIA